ncbi:MAG: hypothetical protein ACRD4Y_06805 [Candidatus Acidiferrales bacterium]
MKPEKSRADVAPLNLASMIRGLYVRVARRLNLHPSYVSRVARGERRSEEVNAALTRELQRVMDFIRKTSHARGYKAAREKGAAAKTAKKGIRKRAVRRPAKSPAIRAPR